MRRIYSVTQIELEGPGKQFLSEYADQRVLLTPNHPTNAEPGIMFALSGELGQRFTFVSNREAYDRGGGLFGKLLQKLNVYSLVRGIPDRESFRYTRSVLAKRGARLVIFPEGEVYSQNDTLLPFQSGVFQLAFFALDDLKKSGDDSPIYIVPVAIKYKFLEDMTPAIERSMHNLEKELGLRSEDPPTLYDRLRRVGEAVVAATERVYDVEPSGNLDQRIAAVKEAMIERIATALDLDTSQLTGSNSDKMRFLINEFYSVTKDEDIPDSIYEVRLYQQARDRALPLLHDLNRLSNWIAVRDNYVAENPTQERMVDTLRRLEVEVHGEARTNGKRKAHVRVANPINLANHSSGYAENKKAAVNDVAQRVESTVQEMLDSMSLR